jgi:hypothetical protein
VEGNLNIEGVDIIDLTALGALAEVGGDLQISDSPGIEDLDGLNALESVGGVASDSQTRRTAECRCALLPEQCKLAIDVELAQSHQPDRL